MSSADFEKLDGALRAQSVAIINFERRLEEFKRPIPAAAPVHKEATSPDPAGARFFGPQSAPSAGPTEYADIGRVQEEDEPLDEGKSRRLFGGGESSRTVEEELAAPAGDARETAFFG